MFSKLTLWHWTSNWCGLPWRGAPLLLPYHTQLPVVVCIGMRPHGLISIQSDTFLSVLFSSHLGDLVGENMGVASDVTRRHNHIAKSLILWLAGPFSPI